MNFINETNFSKNVFGLFVGRLNNFFSNNYSSLNDVFTKYIPEIAPRISIVSRARQAGEELQHNEAIVLGFFQACYARRVNDYSQETRQKAMVIFNKLLQASEEAPDPTLYAQEEMYRMLTQALNPFWDSNAFIKDEHHAQFLADHRYANDQLQNHFSFIPTHTLDRFAYYLALLNLSQSYSFANKKGIQNLLNFDSDENTAFCSHQTIDNMINQLNALSNSPSIIFALTDVLNTLDIGLSQKMEHYEGGEIKREVLAVALKYLLWDKLQTVQLEDCQPLLQKIEETAKDEDSLANTLEMTAGAILYTNLRMHCHPKQFNPSLFAQIRSIYPDISDEEIIRFLGQLFALDEEQMQDILGDAEKLMETQSKEYAHQVLSAFFFLQAGLNYLANNMSTILFEKMIHNDLKSFYSDELRWIPRDLHQAAEIKFNSCLNTLRITFTSPEFVTTLSELFDEKGKAKTNKLTPSQIDVPINQTVMQQVIEADLLGEVKEKGQSSNKNEIQYLEVEQMIDGLAEDYNDAAFEKLLDIMRKDKKIKQVIIKKFEENWKSGDCSYFGADIKQGVLLTEQKREQILREARYLSTQAELTAEFEGFKRRLNKDISEGKFVPIKQKMLRARYPDFFSLMQRKTRGLNLIERDKWQKDYRKIVGDALLMHDMKKLESRSTQTPGSFVENLLLNLRKLGDADDLEVRQNRHEAELIVLKTLLEGQGLVGMEMESVKRKIAEAKLEGRLKASGVPKGEIEAYKTIIQTMELIYEQLLIDSQELKKEFHALPEGFPKQRRQWLKNVKALFIEADISNHISKTLKDIVSKNWNELVGLTSEKITNKICLLNNPFHSLIKNGKLGQLVEEELKPRIIFHEKWSGRLKGEMIQGLVKQEDFLSGVCAAVAGRWAVNDQRFPDASVEALCASYLLEISKTDRFLQGHVSAAFKLGVLETNSMKKGEEILEKGFPPALRKILGIQDTELLWDIHGAVDPLKNSYPVLTAGELEEFKNIIGKNLSKLQNSHGVMVLRLDFADSAHRIYLRYDPNHEPPVFRLGEPNAGIFELKNEQEFFECFNDLCQIFYKSSGVNEIRVIQLILS